MAHGVRPKHVRSVLFFFRGVEYPKLYAEGTNAVSVRFNCTQRVHQNTMENLPTFLIMQLLLAQAYPLTASALGLVWAVGELPASLQIGTLISIGVSFLPMSRLTFWSQFA